MIRLSLRACGVDSGSLPPPAAAGRSAERLGRRRRPWGAGRPLPPFPADVPGPTNGRASRRSCRFGGRAAPGGWRRTASRLAVICAAGTAKAGGRTGFAAPSSWPGAGRRDASPSAALPDSRTVRMAGPKRYPGAATLGKRIPGRKRRRPRPTPRIGCSRSRSRASTSRDRDGAKGVPKRSRRRFAFVEQTSADAGEPLSWANGRAPVVLEIVRLRPEKKGFDESFVAISLRPVPEAPAPRPRRRAPPPPRRDPPHDPSRSNA